MTLFLESAGASFNRKPRGVKPPDLLWLGAGVIGMQADSNTQNMTMGALALLALLEIGTYWSTVVFRDRS